MTQTGTVAGGISDAGLQPDFSNRKSFALKTAPSPFRETVSIAPGLTTYALA